MVQLTSIQGATTTNFAYCKECRSFSVTLCLSKEGGPWTYQSVREISRNWYRSRSFQSHPPRGKSRAYSVANVFSGKVPTPPRWGGKFLLVVWKLKKDFISRQNFLDILCCRKDADTETQASKVQVCNLLSAHFICGTCSFLFSLPELWISARPNGWPNMC